MGINTAVVTTQTLADNTAKLNALKEGQVDAIHVAKPDWLIFKRNAGLSDKYQILFDSSTSKKAQMPIGIIVRSEYLKDHRTEVINFSKALLEADIWIKNNPEEFITLLEGRFTDIPKEDIKIQAQSYLDTLDNLEFTPNLEKGQEMLDLVKPGNDAANDYKIEDFISLEISNALTKSGFLQQFGFK